MYTFFTEDRLLLSFLRKIFGFQLNFLLIAKQKLIYHRSPSIPEMHGKLSLCLNGVSNYNAIGKKKMQAFCVYATQL